ncbi:MAG: vitamin B12-dependent ribonucleotide reductase, partial [Bdellovibrio sp.]
MHLQHQKCQTQKTSSPKKQKKELGLIKPHFCKDGKDPLEKVKYRITSSQITNTEGKVIFSMDHIEVPESWSQLACDILISKYLRRNGVPQTESETSVKQVIKRITKSLAKEGMRLGYLSKREADIFDKELRYILVHQIAAFNSPVWFNLGLWHEYKIEGQGGHYYWDKESDTIKITSNAFQYPQCSACFIQSVEDDLMGLFDLLKNEAKLFKFGSGTGTNFSNIRAVGEKLSGGGTTSGLMSFLEVFDRAAGATKSGGTTRRAAKMVCLDIDHPEILSFIQWKQKEEQKVKVLIDGGYSSDFNGEAYKTISGQNSNNSVRVTDEFMKAVEEDQEWQTTYRTTGEVAKTFKARELWEAIAKAAWTCADPGLQFHSTINEWHTCPHSGPIRASNPCSEYMFLDNSACNLASINLVKMLNQNGEFDITKFTHTIDTLILAQDILVDASSYPTQKIAENSHQFRTLGLGYANLGSLLMLKGLPYDSEEARQVAAALTSLLTSQAYLMSTQISKKMKPFSEFERNKTPMLK